MNASRPILRLKRQPVPEPRPVADNCFAFVWRVGGYRPSRRHATREAAIAEAKRLQESHRSDTFNVYEVRLVASERITKNET